MAPSSSPAMGHGRLLREPSSSPYRQSTRRDYLSRLHPLLQTSWRGYAPLARGRYHWPIAPKTSLAHSPATVWSFHAARADRSTRSPSPPSSSTDGHRRVGTFYVSFSAERG